jgi:hypothetical protein
VSESQIVALWALACGYFMHWSTARRGSEQAYYVIDALAFALLALAFAVGAECGCWVE